jgi:hypothetical protein
VVRYDGNNKQFVSHRHVQAIVADAWRGFYVGSRWALPRHSSSLWLLLSPSALRLQPVTDAAVVGLRSDTAAAPSKGGRGSAHTIGAFEHIWGLLTIPRVKFSLFLASYLLYLLVYYAVIAQEDGLPHWELSAVDLLLYVWALSLLLAELWQMVQNRMSGEEHFASFWNYIDLVSPSVVLLSAAVHAVAANLCAGADTEHEGEGDGSSPSPPPPSSSSSSSSSHLGFAARFEACPLLVVSRVPLALNAVPSFLRVLDWLTVYQPLGVLEVLLASMLENVFTFLVLAAIVCAGFSATFLGLVPELGTGWSHLDTGLADMLGHHAQTAGRRELKGGGGGAHGVHISASALDGSGADRQYWTLSSAPLLPIFALYGDLGVVDPRGDRIQGLPPQLGSRQLGRDRLVVIPLSLVGPARQPAHRDAVGDLRSRQGGRRRRVDAQARGGR